MKKYSINEHIILFVIIISFLVGSFSYSQQSVLARTEEVILGSIEERGVTVNIPSGSFSEEVTVTLSFPKAPFEEEASFSTIAPVIDIQGEGDIRRTFEPVTITLKTDLSEVEEFSAVYAIYYNEINGWDAIIPDFIDPENDTITFTTYHFSTYSAAELKEDARVTEFVNRKSVERWVSQNVEGEGDSAREEMVREILSQGMGINDESVLSIIADAVIKELPGGKMGSALMGGDYEKLSEEVLKGTVKQLSKHVEDIPLLKELASEPGHIVAIAKASAAGLEGEGEEALKYMAEHIVNYVIDKTPVLSGLSKITKTWVKIVDHKINVWEYEEIEKAYQVYRDGASSRVPFWGYNVEPGNFDELWEQMRGISTKITRDALQNYADARGIKVEDLSFEEQNRIREQARLRLEEQFAARKVQEKEIESIKEEKMMLLEVFRERGLLDRSYSNPMYTEHDDLESLLRRITQLTERIKRDTGRFTVVSSLHDDNRDYDDVGVLRDHEILSSQLGDLVWVWYNEGPEAYEEKIIALKLKKETATGINGQWSFVLKDIEYLVQVGQGIGDKVQMLISVNDAGKGTADVHGIEGTVVFDVQTKQIAITITMFYPANDLVINTYFNGTVNDNHRSMVGSGSQVWNDVVIVRYAWNAAMSE